MVLFDDTAVRPGRQADRLSGSLQARRPRALANRITAMMTQE